MHGSDGSFDALEFLHYLRSRRLFFAVSCGIAVALALVVSLLLPKRYTATATILIEAPGGNDPRAATAVSQVYLDSLKTWESVAASDTLFLEALDRLHVRDAKSNVPIESLKRGVLKVAKRPSTSILEISATWNDPRKAQALAQSIAEQTVALGKSIDARSADEALKQIRADADAARQAWTRIRRKRDDYRALNPIAALENEVADESRFRSLLERDLELAKADFAELSAQPAAGGAQAAAARARVGAFEDQRRVLIARLEKIETLLETRAFRRDALDDEENAAHATYEALETRRNDMLSSSGLRGTHLEIVDPGIVPRQPGSPDTRLNVVAALFASIVTSFVWLVFRFSYRRLLQNSAERVYSLR